MKLRPGKTVYPLPKDYVEGKTTVTIKADRVEWELTQVTMREVADWLALGQLPKTRVRGMPSVFAIDMHEHKIQLLPPPARAWTAVIEYSGRRVG